MSRTSSHEDRRRRTDRGAVLVEFALVLPIFSLMLFAIIQFGTLFAGWAQLRNAVQTAAREESIGQLNASCGDLSQPACSVAVLIGAPIGLTSPSERTTSISIPDPDQAQCEPSLTSCADYSWLDGYYLDSDGTWDQIVSSFGSPPAAGQISDQQAMSTGASGTWRCTDKDVAGYCTNLSTQSATGTGNPMLGSDYDNIAVSSNSGLVFVCARLSATPFTNLLPTIVVSTESSFYTETGTATTANQGGLPCG